MSTDRPKQLASESRRTVFSCHEGGEAVMTFPTPLTEATIDMLAELSELMFRALRRDAVKWSNQQRAEAEYQSWFAAQEPPCPKT